MKRNKEMIPVIYQASVLRTFLELNKCELLLPLLLSTVHSNLASEIPCQPSLRCWGQDCVEEIDLFVIGQLMGHRLLLGGWER